MRRLGAAGLAASLGWALACAEPIDSPAPAKTQADRESSSPSDKGDWFSDVTQQARLDFTHLHGGLGERTMVETMGAGGGVFDFDRDGWLDLYLVQSGPLPDTTGSTPQANQLYRNLGPSAEGFVSFANITNETGGGDTGYGMGACFADVDNDGFTDVYVTNFGADRLWRNEGGDRLIDVTESAGIDNPAWGTSCAFADFDRDGCLDLYVVNYVDFRLETHRRCVEDGFHVYCHPDVYQGESDVLYRNRCDGTFDDVTTSSGVRNDDPRESKGLGAVWSDVDDDGDVDLYVTNDSTRNFLYQNNGSSDTFREIGVSSGTAFNDQGVTEAGMGTDAGDVDGDGRFDLFVAHLDFETNTLYRNQGRGMFFDTTAAAGLAAPSMSRVGFGSNLFDADNDGDLDLFVANGHILDNIHQQKPSLTYGQPDQLFVNAGDGKFADRSADAGPHFERTLVGRGSAVADFDNDGDLDLLITHSNQRAILLENRRGSRHPALTLHLESRFGGRDAIGAKVTLVSSTTSTRSQVAEIRSGSSYLSQGDLRIHFGLGPAPEFDHIEIRWPEGEMQTIPEHELAIDRVNIVSQGQR